MVLPKFKLGSRGDMEDMKAVLVTFARSVALLVQSLQLSRRESEWSAMSVVPARRSAFGEPWSRLRGVHRLEEWFRRIFVPKRPVHLPAIASAAAMNFIRHVGCFG